MLAARAHEQEIVQRDYPSSHCLSLALCRLKRRRPTTYGAMTGKASPPHAALFHNHHDGTFTDVAEKAGVTNYRWGFGVAVGDYDNDGWLDLYVTNFGKNRLFHNHHDGTFTDVAEKAGVTLGNWSSGATFGDYDGDGRLDLFVPGYVHYDIDHPPVSGSPVRAFSTCEFGHSTAFHGSLKHSRRSLQLRRLVTYHLSVESGFVLPVR